MEDINFLLTDGSILGIKINDSVSKLYDAINKDLLDEITLKRTIIHRYKTEESDIEFYSKNSILIGIIVKFWNNERYCVGTQKQVIITSTTSLYNFLSMLETLQLTWEIATQGTSGTTLCIRLSSKIICVFDLERQALVKIGTEYI